MRGIHCTCVLVVLLLLSSSARGNQESPAESETYGFIVFLRGAAIGREDVTTKITTDGKVTISGRGRLAPPLDIVVREAEVHYQNDWTPESLLIEGTLRGDEIELRTNFKGTEAQSETRVNGQIATETDTVTATTIVLPNLFMGTYEALARRLKDVVVDTELPVFIAPQQEIKLRVNTIRQAVVQTGTTTFPVRQYDLTMASPSGDLQIQLSTDEVGRLVRLTVPTQTLDVVREDVAASTSRTVLHSNPSDESVMIPANGFNLAATITLPTLTLRNQPAVVLVPGTTGDRDGVVAGTPILSQLAGTLAEAGFLVIRYDRRGYGQSGGRAEAATIDRFAEDARTVVRYIGKRKDVDSKRIAIIGHGEGAWIALLTASRENRVSAVVSIAGAATTGAELILEQQRLMLEQMQVPDAERQAKIVLQKQINSAVISGEGWEEVPQELRQQADSPWFQSLLTYNPSKILEKIDQPILILHGELDHQVPVSHAKRLAELAHAMSDSKAIKLATIRDLTHPLVQEKSSANSGTMLSNQTISTEATGPLIDWLSKMLAVRR